SPTVAELTVSMSMYARVASRTAAAAAFKTAAPSEARERRTAPCSVSRVAALVDTSSPASGGCDSGVAATEAKPWAAADKDAAAASRPPVSMCRLPDPGICPPALEIDGGRVLLPLRLGRKR